MGKFIYEVTPLERWIKDFLTTVFKHQHIKVQAALVIRGFVIRGFDYPRLVHRI